MLRYIITLSVLFGVEIIILITVIRSRTYMQVLHIRPFSPLLVWLCFECLVHVNDCSQYFQESSLQITMAFSLDIIKMSAGGQGSIMRYVEFAANRGGLPAAAELSHRVHPPCVVTTEWCCRTSCHPGDTGMLQAWAQFPSKFLSPCKALKEEKDQTYSLSVIEWRTQ